MPSAAPTCGARALIYDATRKALALHALSLGRPTPAPRARPMMDRLPLAFGFVAGLLVAMFVAKVVPEFWAAVVR